MIHFPNTGHPPGTVIVAAAIQPRYYEFQLSLDKLAVPSGTKLHIERGCDIASNFNGGIRKMTGEWAWFLGDDHAFEPNVLMHFLEHNVDVVVPIAPCKVPPWLPCVMHSTNGNWHEKMPLYQWGELSGRGLFKLPRGDFIGQAGMLVKKHVLDEIGYPWFKCGQIDPGRLQEDLAFCRELQQLGYVIHVDQDVIFDHFTPMCVTARRHEGKWAPALQAGTDNTVVLPDAVPFAKQMLDLLPPAPAGRMPMKWTTVEKS